MKQNTTDVIMYVQCYSYMRIYASCRSTSRVEMWKEAMVQKRISFQKFSLCKNKLSYLVNLLYAFDEKWISNGINK